ncbi:hypothetical protein AGMMS50276_31100 [Synergistales bacterium]|nr:hypothetical protein AGMMS50276_31100 [Synergistales bacterium]
MIEKPGDKKLLAEVSKKLAKGLASIWKVENDVNISVNDVNIPADESFGTWEDFISKLSEEHPEITTVLSGEAREKARQKWQAGVNLIQALIEDQRAQYEAQIAELEKQQKQKEREIEEQAAKIAELESRDGFYLLPENQATNKLSRRMIRKPQDIDRDLDKLGNFILSEDNFRMRIEGYVALQKGIGRTAPMFLDNLLIVAGENGLKKAKITLSLKEYMARRGLHDVKSARAQVKRDIDALERIQFDFKGRRGDWLHVDLSGGTNGIVDGNIIFYFSEVFIEMLKTDKSFFYLPKLAMLFNSHDNPFSYGFLRRILEHKRMNAGKSNEESISVETLIEACTYFPEYDGYQRGFIQRILEPFERDMNKLESEGVLKWEYKGEQPLDYEAFLKAVIIARLPDYPSQDSIINSRERRHKQIERAETRAIAAAKVKTNKKKPKGEE